MKDLAQELTLAIRRIDWVITRMKGIEKYRNIEFELLTIWYSLRSIQKSIESLEKAEENG